jgi:hypothetical protein
MTNKKDENIGFKEFLEGEDKAFLENPNIGSKSRNNSNFELETFLEQDSNRMSKLIETFEEKAFVIKKFSQFPQLEIEAEAKNIAARIETIELCTRENSPLFANIDSIFKKFFK